MKPTLLPPLLVLLMLFASAAAALEMEELVPWLDSISDEELRNRLDDLDDVNATDADGASLLHHAVCKAPERVPLLLDEGLDPNLQDQQDATPLHRLFRCGHPPALGAAQELTAELLRAGADPDRADASGRTPLHAALAGIRFRAGTRDFYRSGARTMLEHEADPERADDNGVTPLLLAAGEPEGRLTGLMLALDADVDTVDHRDRTALWEAAGRPDNAATFSMLLEAGADPLIAPEGGASTLERVLDDGDWRKLDALLRVLPNAVLPEQRGTSLLAEALWDGAGQQTLERFLEAGANPLALAEQEFGDLAWRLAEQDRVTLLDRLLELGLDINEVPASGLAPLVPASADAAGILLERGADLTLTGPAGGTALVPPTGAPARFLSHLDPPGRDKARLLLDAGYPPDLRDHHGRTALESAVQHNQLWLVRELLDAGADPAIQSTEHASVLPLALVHDRLPMLRALTGALDDPAGKHPELLTRYLEQGGRDAAVVEWLLLQGFSTEYRDPGGNTPVLLAARAGQDALVDMLLDYGAEREVVNYSGCDLACYRRDGPDATAAVPRIEQAPAAFYALALAPALILYLVLMGLRLHRNQPLTGLTLRGLAALALAVPVSASLFYRCDPCLVQGDQQLYVSALLALTLFLLCLLPRRRGRISDNTDPQ